MQAPTRETRRDCPRQTAMTAGPSVEDGGVQLQEAKTHILNLTLPLIKVIGLKSARKIDKDGTCGNDTPTLIGCVRRICHSEQLSRAAGSRPGSCPQVRALEQPLYRTIPSRSNQNLGSVHKHSRSRACVHKRMQSAPGRPFTPMKLQKR